MPDAIRVSAPFVTMTICPPAKLVDGIVIALKREYPEVRVLDEKDLNLVFRVPSDHHYLVEMALVRICAGFGYEVVSDEDIV